MNIVLSQSHFLHFLFINPDFTLSFIISLIVFSIYIFSLLLRNSVSDFLRKISDFFENFQISSKNSRYFSEKITVLLTFNHISRKPSKIHTFASLIYRQNCLLVSSNSPTNKFNCWQHFFTKYLLKTKNSLLCSTCILLCLLPNFYHCALGFPFCLFVSYTTACPTIAVNTN